MLLVFRARLSFKFAILGTSTIIVFSCSFVVDEFNDGLLIAWDLLLKLDELKYSLSTRLLSLIIKALLMKALFVMVSMIVLYDCNFIFSVSRRIVGHLCLSMSIFLLCCLHRVNLLQIIVVVFNAVFPLCSLWVRPHLPLDYWRSFNVDACLLLLIFGCFSSYNPLIVFKSILSNHLLRLH